MNNKMLNMVAFYLTVVGALNWGLVALANFNVVEMLLGAGSSLTQIVYILVGVSAVWVLINRRGN